MVSEEAIVWIMGLPVHDTLIVILTILKDYQFCGGIYALSEILANTTSRRSHLSFIQVSSNRKLLNNAVCVGRMCMSFCWSGSNVALKPIASIVIFTNVAANIVSDEEFATWMLAYKFIYVKDEIIKKDILLSISDAALKLLPRHRSTMRFELLPFALLHLISHFTG